MELKIIKFFQSYKSLFFDVFFGTFSYLAGFIGFLILFFILFYINKKYSFYYIFSYFLINFINYILKIIINRPRPYEIDKTIINIISATGKSFPSGHMTSATIMCLFVLYLVYKFKPNPFTKILSIMLALIYLSLVAISRMYLGQHYLSDLVGSFIISLVLTSILVIIYDKKLFKKNI